MRRGTHIVVVVFCFLDQTYPIYCGNLQRTSAIVYAQRHLSKFGASNSHAEHIKRLMTCLLYPWDQLQLSKYADLVDPIRWYVQMREHYCSVACIGHLCFSRKREKKERGPKWPCGVSLLGGFVRSSFGVYLGNTSRIVFVRSIELGSRIQNRQCRCNVFWASSQLCWHGNNICLLYKCPHRLYMLQYFLFSLSALLL